MPEIDRRPANGAGSCARCEASLTLASVKVNGVWYCSTSCADGRRASEAEAPRVPETWLYARPRRHFRRRHPKELNTPS